MLRAAVVAALMAVTGTHLFRSVLVSEDRVAVEKSAKAMLQHSGVTTAPKAAAAIRVVDY